MEEPNWGLNLRICAMINSEEFNGTEIVKAIKKKIGSGKSAISQRLSLDLLETFKMGTYSVVMVVCAHRYRSSGDGGFSMASPGTEEGEERATGSDSVVLGHTRNQKSTRDFASYLGEIEANLK
ncbi:hypothetical protein LXL04_005203 [Taraxacum kok-saghyz]